MKKILVFVCLCTAFSFANAQDYLNSEDDESQWLKNRVGLYGSFFSGYGLSYQYQFDNGISLRTQLFAYGSDNDNSNYNSTEIQLAYGIDLQYNLQRTKSTRFYVLAGSFIDYYEDGYYYDNDNYDIERYINVGLGFGIEIMAWRNISIMLEGGYYGRFGNNTVSVYRYGDERDIKETQNPRSFGFGVGGGIFYAF